MKGKAAWLGVAVMVAVIGIGVFQGSLARCAFEAAEKLVK